MNENKFNAAAENLTNTENLTSQFDAQDIEANKIMAILAYLSFLVLVPIFAAKESKFARFHVNQGLVLFIVEVIISALLGFLMGIPVVGIVAWIASGVLWLAAIVMSVLGILNAARGEAKRLPLIGHFEIFK